MISYKYLANFIGVLALDSALRSGLMDRLQQEPVQAGGAGTGEDILLGLLDAGGYCACSEQEYTISKDFEEVLISKRNVLEKQIEIIKISARDVLSGLDPLLFDLPEFMRRSEMFALFRYDRAMVADPENIEATRRWVDYVTALTELEAPLIVEKMDLTGRRHLLEIGGNSGAFALELLAANPTLNATILDLPIVCQLGRQHVADRPEAGRLSFVEGDARRMNWRLAGNEQPDVVIFKSVLHDWPEEEAVAMIEKAFRALPSGGNIYICERDQVQRASDIGFFMVANLVFAPFYRQPDTYTGMLAAKGFGDVKIEAIEMEMPFNVISGQKP